MKFKRHSLFGKLFLVFTGLIIGIICAFFISFKCFGNKPLAKVLQTNVKNYSLYLIQDIGTPVTIEALKRVEEKTKVGTITSTFKSNPNLPDLNQLERIHTITEDYWFARFDSKKYVVMKQNGETFAFAIHLNLKHEFPFLPLGVATFVSFLLLAVAYHIVKRIFQPLEEIKEGAAHFAKGDFSYPIPVKGKDQLADLSLSIKEMGAKIQEMLESKRELLLAIAHELRTPMTRAKLHLELMDDGPKKDQLNLELNEMSQLVNDILESERLKEGHGNLNKVNTNLKYWIEDVLSSYEGEDIKAELIEIHHNIDPIRYSIALKNLISNALRHGKGFAIEVTLTTNGFSVTNKGEEIPPEEIDKITEAFYRPDKSRMRMSDGGGVGLGLYLVHQVVKAHGHQLKITSENGRTVFKVCFS